MPRKMWDVLSKAQWPSSPYYLSGSHQLIVPSTPNINQPEAWNSQRVHCIQRDITACVLFIHTTQQSMTVLNNRDCTVSILLGLSLTRVLVLARLATVVLLCFGHPCLILSRFLYLQQSKTNVNCARHGSRLTHTVFYYRVSSMISHIFLSNGKYTMP